MMLEDRKDCGNDATSKILSDIPNINTLSPGVTSQFSHDNHVSSSLIDDSLFDVGYSEIVEEVVIDDKISDFSPHLNYNDEMKEVTYDEDLVSNDNDNQKNMVVNNTDENTTDKFLPDNDTTTDDQEETTVYNSAPEVTVNDDFQDHTYQSFPGQIPEANEIPNDKGSVDSDKPHKCHICGKLFSRQSSLRGHIRLHVEGPDNMLRNTSITESVRTENTDNTSGNVYCCVFCDERFPRKSLLKYHIQSHLNSNIESEPTVNGNVEANETISDSVDANESTENEKREYNCIICEKSFSRRSSLTCHYKNHPAEKSPVKNQNEMETNDVEADDGDSKHYKCFKCIRTFARQSSLISHLKLHEINPKRRSVDLDAEKSNDTESTKVQLSNGDCQSQYDKVEEVSQEFKCELCDKSFSQIKGLRMHNTMHRVEKCELSKNQKIQSPLKLLTDMDFEEVTSADYTCYSKNHLHNQVVKLFKCNVCQKCYCDIGNLKRHFILHRENAGTDTEIVSEDDQVKSVKVCERDIYNDTSSESKQSEANFIVGLYKCGVCDEAFDEIDLLKNHVTVHIRVQIRCETCHRCFPSNDALKDHICGVKNSPAYDDTEFVCVVCDLKFSNGSTLKRHMNCHRRVEEEIITKVSSSGRKIKDPRIHQEDDTDKAPDSLKCRCCNRIFSSVRTRRLHESYKVFEPDKPTIMSPSENPEAVVCDCCNRQFQNMRALRTHISRGKTKEMNVSKNEVSKPEEPELEPVADKTEINDQNVNLDSLKCSCCDKLFTSIRALTIHVSNQSNHVANSHDDASAQDSDRYMNIIKCDRCDNFFTSISALKLHIKDHTRKILPETENALPESENTPELSPDRDETVSESQPEIVHDENNSDLIDNVDGVYECEKCGKKFDHLRSKNIHKTRWCHLIAQKLETNVDTEDPKEYECCGKTFATQRAMKTHQYRSHPHAEPESEPETMEDVQQSDNEGEYICCGRNFETSRALKIHQYYHSNMESDAESETNLTCDCCNKTFATPKTLQNHLARAAERGDSDVEEYRCNLCNQTFENNKKLNSHLAQHTKDDSDDDVFVSLSCDICEKIFKNSKTLKKHRACHTESDEEFKCPECEAVFQNAKSLRGHISRKHGKINDRYDLFSLHTDGTFQCNVCQRSFHSKNSINQHCEGHRNDLNGTQYPCPLCDRIFSSGNALGGHKSKVHPRSDEIKDSETEDDSKIESMVKKKKISIPEKLVQKQDNVSIYIEPDTGIKIYQCLRCDRSFSTRSGYAGHCKNHARNTENKSSQMESNDSVVIDQLDEPVVEDVPIVENSVADETTNKTKAEIDSYQCVVCDRIFTSKKGLIKHTEMHKRRCFYCNRMFHTQAAMKRHERTHTKSVKCDNGDTTANNSIPGNDTITKIQVESFFESSVNETMNETDIIMDIEVENSTNTSTSIHEESVNVTNVDQSFEAIAEAKIDELPSSDELICDICLREFKTEKALKRHTMWHKFNDFAEDAESDEMFKCNFCEKVFTDFDTVQRHLSFHGVLPNGSWAEKNRVAVKCDQCGEFFSQTASLMEHSVEVHDKVITDNVNWKCQHCERTFVKAKALRMHLRIHRSTNLSSEVEVMPFECISCEKCFRLKDDLLEHVKTHAEDELDEDALEQVNELTQSTEDLQLDARCDSETISRKDSQDLQLDESEQRYDTVIEDSQFGIGEDEDTDGHDQVIQVNQVTKCSQNDKTQFNLSEVINTGSDIGTIKDSFDKLDADNEIYKDSELSNNTRDEVANQNETELEGEIVEESNNTVNSTDILAEGCKKESISSNEFNESESVILNHTIDDNVENVNLDVEENIENIDENLAAKHTDDVDAEKSKSIENDIHENDMKNDELIHSNYLKDELPDDSEDLDEHDSDDFELKIEVEDIDVTTNLIDETINSAKQDVFPCKDCNKVFLRKRNLGTHLRVHNRKIAKLSKLVKSNTKILRNATPIKPHKCTTCNLSFRLKSTLDDHCLSHVHVKSKRTLKRQNSSVEDDSVRSSKRMFKK